MELLRDRSPEFEQAGVRVLGVSRDSAWTHVAWATALDLTFPLLSDWNAVARPVQLPPGVGADAELRRLAVRARLLAARRAARRRPRLERLRAADLPGRGRPRLPLAPHPRPTRGRGARGRPGVRPRSVPGGAVDGP